ncbi:unnamed protein product [Allacma fusca]|uniref:Uncharacterized protein n=1 Tax=Allacma fusca TaxID=39272 RepID=A0A8J2K1L5_9HEXA|nr:unnamed protein product [Allacma fusca]
MTRSKLGGLIAPCSPQCTKVLIACPQTGPKCSQGLPGQHEVSESCWSEKRWKTLEELKLCPGTETCRWNIGEERKKKTEMHCSPEVLRDLSDSEHLSKEPLERTQV